jgi:hypothetical protein
MLERTHLCSDLRQLLSDGSGVPVRAATPTLAG